MKKLLLMVLFAIVLLTGSVIAAGDVAYITRGSIYTDNNVVNAIQDLGYSVDFIDDSEITSTNFSDYMMMLVPDQLFSNYVQDIPVNQINSVILNTYYMDEWNWVYMGVSQTSSSQPLEGDIVDSSSRITEGLPSNFDVYTQAKDNGIGIPMYFLPKGRKASGLKGIVSGNDPLDLVIVKANKGTKLRNGEISDARTVFFGITESDFWTNNSERLFKNSVEWVMEGDDFDNDGYFTDEDCNDSNADVWQIFEGYIDNDGDSYGAGPQEDVCSGDSLLSEYSENSLDCDDNNSLVNPDEDEIIYDGIDNDCKNGDLDDLDLDGFKVDCSEITGIQCLVVGGTDCDDSDSSYNRNSTDSTKNCVNEAPVFSGPIGNIIWDEERYSGLLNLKDYFSDPDEDRLEFNISSTSQDGNVTYYLNNGRVTFQSSENWNGNDWIVFYATDGQENTTTNNITLTVNPVNDAPVLDEISTVVVNETDLIEFNVSATDVDFNETLAYYASNLPEGATFIGRLFSWLPNYFQAGIYKILFNVTDGYEWDEQEVTINVNNVNRAPVLEAIDDQFMLEDDELDILINASDPDNEILTYSIINENTSEVNCAINKEKIKLIPEKDWNGVANCEVEVSDKYMATANRSFSITVYPDNDAPVLGKINDITAEEGDLIEISASASDVDDGDVLTFSINDSRFTDNGNGNFTWQTNYNDSGSSHVKTYYVNVSVSDGNLTDFQKVKIVVNNKNQPPVMNPISDVMIDEDSGFHAINESLTAYDPDSDGSIAFFKILEDNPSEVDCGVNGNKLSVEPADDFQGSATCVVGAYDNEGAHGEATVNIIVDNINDAPVITSYWPESEDILTTEDGEIYFGITAEDPDKDSIDVNWSVDGNQVGIQNEYTFTGDGSAGEYYIEVLVTDGSGESDSAEWTVRTTDRPIADSYDGDTTDFSGMSASELESVNLVLEKTGFGKIEFLEPVDLSDVADLDSYTYIQKGMCGIDSSVYNVFSNKDARITFYNLNFLKTPTLYYNSGFTLNPMGVAQICSESVCSDVSYSNGEMSFVVTGFSSFMAGDTLTCEQQSGDVCTENEVCKSSFIEARDSDVCCPTECVPYFKDADTCEVINSSVVVILKDPDNNDEFKPGETIKVDVKVENTIDEKHDFDVEAFLYDLKEGESIDDDNDNVRVGSGNSERVELNLEIPDDIEDAGKSEFYVYVRVEDEDESTICNENYVKLRLNREDDDVVVKSIEISPLIVSQGDRFDVVVRVENIGADEQEDAYVVIENSKLGINQKSEEFNIEEFGEDDSKRLSFVVAIPEDAEDSEYDLKATVFFADGDEKDSKSEKFSVMEKPDLSGFENSGSSGTVISLSAGNIDDSISLNSGSEYPDAKSNYVKLNSDEQENNLVNFAKSAKGALFVLAFLVVFLVVLVILSRS